MTGREIDFKTFVITRSNSMCRNLIRKFPSLISLETKSFSQAATSVLSHFNFIGCQENFTNHSKVLLETMGLPHIEQGIRYNVSKSNDVFNKDLVVENNQEDLILYQNFFPNSLPKNYHLNKAPSDIETLFENKTKMPLQTMVDHLFGELHDLKNNVEIIERREYDRDVVFRRLCSLYFTTKPPKKKRILRLIKNYCKITDVEFDAKYLRTKKRALY